MATILIIDDESIGDVMAHAVRARGHRADWVTTLAQGVEMAEAGNYDVICLDVILPDGNGLEKVRLLHELPSQPEIIILTGMGSADGAELAIRCGAWGYVAKGESLNELLLPLDRALSYRANRRQTRKPVLLDRQGIVGESKALMECLKQVADAGASDVSVLITGETGTGKELLAEVIHRNSPRSKGPFVVVDCAALPETLIDSLLFGHRKGSFTGATGHRMGLMAQANKGTLFLDEVGELPLNMQKTFLRAVQERVFRPVGSDRVIHSDFRVIAATNRDLDVLVREDRFRRDLLFRLRAFTIHLPPLRERKEDILPIAARHTQRICECMGKPTPGFSVDFSDALRSWSWPGNIRELLQAIENALANAGDAPMLFMQHLPVDVRVHLARQSASQSSGTAPILPHDPNDGRSIINSTLTNVRETAIASLERTYLRELLTKVGPNRKRWAEISGLSIPRLYGLLRKYGLSPKETAGQESNVRSQESGNRGQNDMQIGL